MKLVKLVIQGFKSFKDKTVIDFNHSVTGIVGPNGCGKSNIVDALFWVMGEQSAKHLRGSSMKDVIFSGSAKYPPASWAEVSLFLENTEQKHIHVGDKVICPTEFQLTRKLYRSGDSEYRINGIPARLKDIQEVFLDTGVGTKSYSIIAQGEINKLVQSGPLEKRVMIEEVAGITRFKVRKKESLRKLEMTEQNMARLIDLKEEVYKQLKILEEQAGKAERAIVLRDRVQQNELIVESHKEMELLNLFSEKGKELREISESLEQGQIEKSDLETKTESLKIDKEVIAEKTESLRREYNELAKRLAASEERLKYLIKNRDEKKVLLKTRDDENLEIAKDIEGREKKLEEWEKSLEELEENEVSEESYLDLQNHVDILQDEMSIKEETVEGLKKEIEDRKEQLFHLRQEVFKAKSKRSDVEEKFDEVVEKIDYTEKELQNQKENLTKKSSLLNQKEEELRLTKEEKDQVLLDLDEAKTTLNQLKESTQQDQNLITKLDAKINSLNEMKFYDLLPNLQNGEFLKEESGENYKKLFELFKCDDQYAPPIQRFLGQKLETLVALKGGIEGLFDFYEKGGKGYLHSLNLGHLSRSQIDHSIEGGVWAQDIVFVDGENLSYIKSLFENVLIVESLDKAKIDEFLNLMGDESIINLDVLSKDGRIHLKKERGVVQVFLGREGEEGEEFFSPIKRNNEVERLQLELSEAEERVRQNELLRDEPTQKLKNLSDKLEHLEEVENQLKMSMAVLKSEGESIKNFVLKLEGDWEDLKKKRENLSKEKLSFIEKESECQNREEELKADVEEREESLKEVLEDFAYKKSIFAEEKERLITQKSQFENYSREVNNLNKQIEDLEEQLEKLSEREKNNQELIEQYRLECEESDKESIGLDEENKDLAMELKEREKVLQKSKKELQEKLDELEKNDKNLRVLGNKISKWEKDLVYNQTKIEQSIEEEERVVRNMFEKYRVNLRRIMRDYLELSSENLNGLKSIDEIFITIVDGEKKIIEEKPFNFVRKYGQDLASSKEKYQRSLRELQNIGEINWTAVEEYSRQKKRHQFLIDQEVQLKKSLDDLKMAILHIDERCKERFKGAFNDVNERFQKVFPILFGGGQAYLQMQGPFDDLDAGVDIVAQPPGKKMQNINLMSGGEKAMTAVSLIFSTFLVRPSPFCLLDEVDAPLDDANVTRFNEILREMSEESQFIVITHNKKTMELNDVLYGITMQEPGISKTVSVQLH